MSSRNAIRLLGALTLILPLSALAANYDPFTNCCYIGPLTKSRVAEVSLRMQDGRRAAFQEIFADFRAQTGLFKRSPAFRQARIARVHYGALGEVMPQYDANGNGVLEVPELTTLYIREAALGLGHDVATGGVTPAGALALPQSEVGGLVVYIERNTKRMTPHGRAVFNDLAHLARDIRTERDNGHDDLRFMRRAFFLIGDRDH